MIMQELLNVIRLELILSDMAKNLEGIQLSAHLKNCQKLVEQGWLPEFDQTPSLQPLKLYFQDPLQTILVKLFLLKSFYTFHKNSRAIPQEDINWIISTRRNLSEQFKTICQTPDQHIVYNGNHVHTLEELETLARTEPAPFMPTKTLTNIFIAILAMSVINQQTREYQSYGVGTTISAALILSTLWMVYQAVLPMFSSTGQPAPTPSPEVLAINALVNNLFLISIVELNNLRNSSLLEKAKHAKAQVADLTAHLAEPAFLDDCKLLAEQGWEEKYSATPSLQIFKPTEDLTHNYLMRAALSNLISENQHDPDWIRRTQESLNRESTNLLNALIPTTDPRYVNHARFNAAGAFTAFNIYRYFIHDNLGSRQSRLIGLSIAGLCMLYAGVVFFDKLSPISLTAKSFLWGASDQLSFLQRRQFKALLESPEFKELFDVKIEGLKQAHSVQPKK
jgi:hypothetical protein